MFDDVLHVSSIVSSRSVIPTGSNQQNNVFLLCALVEIGVGWTKEKDNLLVRVHKSYPNV